jgi:hypothetical protein
MLNKERTKRQSFLGEDSDARLASVTVGVVGLGGGGSHIVQQLAHIGFRDFVIYDDDVVEDSNLNRLVGGTTADALSELPKIFVAKRTIFALVPDARVRAYSAKWQERPEPLRECQIVFGCVDSYQGRAELEVQCRRYLAHYIDVGMDVHGESPPVVGGQVVLSSPGGACMRCMGFLTPERLSQEAARYGKAGGRPQVVWPNGVLASTAVGIGVDLVCDWTKKPRLAEYLAYDGNRGTLQPSVTLRSLDLASCSHFPSDQVGEPVEVEL